MFCTKCGNQIEDDARFCTKCGQSFENDIDKTAEHIEINAVPTAKKASGWSKAIIVLLSVLIVVIIAAVGVVSYLILGADNGRNLPVPGAPGAPIEQLHPRDTEAAKEVLEGYLTGLPKAVNNGDYSYIEPYILSGSALNEMQVSLVDYNYDRGVTERFISYELEEVEWIDDYTCYLHTEEYYEISFGGDATINEYEWKYTMILQDGQYYLTNLEADD